LWKSLKEITMDYRCYPCLAKAFTKLIEEHNISEDKSENLTREFFAHISSAPNGLIAPEVARMSQYKIKEILKVNDPYKDIKEKSNQYLLDKYEIFKNRIESSENKYDTAIRLAIAGNIIDYAANPDFDLDGTIDKVLKDTFAINDSLILKEEISKAKNVLYLADNAGEIVMDKLFIEHLNHPNITYVVRHAPVINDVTLDDVKQTGIDSFAKVITNGYDAPSTVLPKVSYEFKEAYNNADVIISKGQGNFEGLMNVTDNRIFFLMMVKCDVIGDRLNVNKGSFVVCRNK